MGGRAENKKKTFFNTKKKVTKNLIWVQDSHLGHTFPSVVLVLQNPVQSPQEIPIPSAGGV